MKYPSFLLGFLVLFCLLSQKVQG